MLGLNYVWMLGSHAGYYKRATAVGINLTIGNSAGLVVSPITLLLAPNHRPHVSRSAKFSRTRRPLAATSSA